MTPLTVIILRQVDTLPGTRRKKRHTSFLIISIIENRNSDNDDKNVIVETNSRPTALTETLGTRRGFCPRSFWIRMSMSNEVRITVSSSYIATVIAGWLESECDGKTPSSFV
jgi:hypothetical protein